MGDDLDGCECYWSHELGIRRLLNFIRQNQEHCSDTECIDLPSLGNPGLRTSATDDDVGGGFTTLTMMLLFAVILFLMRPNRNRPVAIKAGQNDNSPGGPGPQPPAIN